jgi:hypothetical protein
MQLRYALYGALAPAVLALAASAQHSMVVIHCEVPTSPKSIVPFALDLAGMPDTTRFKSLEDFFVSPDGSLWILRGRTEQGSDLENIMLLGSDTSTLFNFAQEGQPIPGGAPGELYDFFGSGVGRFNNLNQFAYSARARGGVSSVFQKLLFWDSVSTSIRFQMGDPYFGLVDVATNPSGDELVGNSVGSIHVLDNGVIGAQDSTIQNIHSSRRPAIFYDQTAFHQTNVTTVTGLGGVGTETWKTITANAFYTSAAGNRWIARGQIQTGSTADDDVLVVDGQVALQEGSPVPGSALTLGAIFDNQVTSLGTWYARGRDTTSTAAWGVVNGVVVVETGMSIGGGTETYGGTFYAFTANDVGDWALACNTDNPDSSSDNVLVINGVVVAREGDPVDLDDNGLFDNDAFIGRGNDALAAFKANALHITNDGVLYATIYLRDGQGNDLGSQPSFGTPDAFVKIEPGDPCAPSVYCTSQTSTAGCTPSIGWTGTPSASAGSGFLITASGVQQSQFGLMIYGTNGPAANPFNGGTLCMVAPLRTPVQNSGGTPPCGGSFSLDFNAFIAGSTNPALVVGAQVQAQYWSRDPGAPGGSNLSDALSFVICP